MEQQKIQYILGSLTNPIELRKKLIPLVEECGKLSEEDELGWALLAKLIYACDQEMLKTISSRIQKRLIASTRRAITVPLLHFIRSFLVSFSWIKDFNEQALASLCSRAVDFNVENSSESITRLTSNVYALWAGTKYDYILIKTLKNLLNNTVGEEKVGSENVLLHFKTAVHRCLPQFVFAIFSLHTEVMGRCSPGDEIAINEWLDIARDAAAVVDVEKRNSIFRWLKTFLLKAGSCAYFALQKISSFINDFSHPSEAYYEAVKEYVRLGPSLSISALFRALIRSARYHLNSQEYGKEYAEALGAMLEVRPYLLDIQDVIELQQIVCEEAFQNRNCRPALSLLNSLLVMNSELVPSPIQIAQSIFNACESWCDEVRLGRALCSSISRPRIQTIILQEDLLKKLSDTVMRKRQIYPDNSQDTSRIVTQENLTEQSYTGDVNNGFYKDSVMENSRIQIADVRKREYRPRKKKILKRMRVLNDSENGGEIVPPRTENSLPLETVGVMNDEKIPTKAGNSLLEQKELQITAILEDAALVKSNSNLDYGVMISDEQSLDHELTVQQMMTDFVPSWK